jgi:hypothetical protein
MEAEEDEEVISRIVGAGEGSCENDIEQANVQLIVNVMMFES